MPDLNMPAPRAPFLDPRTSLVAREWYLFLSSLGTYALDGDKGDIIVSENGSVVTIAPGSVGITDFDATITAAGKALLDDADAAAQRTTLGISATTTPYDESVAGNWASGIPPDFVNVALDQLVNRVKALEVTRQAIAVGGLYLSTVATDPELLLGYGSWSLVSEGRVLVGLDSLDPDFDAVGNAGGAKTVAAAGTISGDTGNDSGVAVTVTAGAGSTVAVSPHTHSGSSLTFTGSATSVVQPSYVCYIWERIS